MAKQIQINLSNKLYYIILTLGALIILSLGVYAYNSPINDPSIMGHSANEIEGGVSSGAVMYFNLASCPLGWSELIEAQGRYIVGLPSGGTLAGTTGTALTDGEDRAVGQHNHGASSASAGSHNGHITDVSAQPANVGGTGAMWRQNSGSYTDPDSNALGAHSHTITVNNAGSVVGTNAPYIQLLVCQKD